MWTKENICEEQENASRSENPCVMKGSLYESQEKNYSLQHSCCNWNIKIIKMCADKKTSTGKIYFENVRGIIKKYELNMTYSDLKITSYYYILFSNLPCNFIWTFCEICILLRQYPH